MAGDKIDYTKQAAQFLVQHLGSRDRFSIVLYNDKVETLLPPEIVSNKDSVIQLIDKIRVRGTTNLSGGWLEGCQHVAKNLSKHSLNRVILMSDGLANRGVTDKATLISMAQQKRHEEVSTTTMGLGKDFNEDLMMEMANAAGGAFYFIESPEVTPSIFQEELSGLLSVVGQNLTITVIPTEHVSGIHQLNAYSVDIDSKMSSFRLGDIFANEVKTLVLELSIPAMAQLGEQQIAILRFEYDEIVEGTTKHHIQDSPVIVNFASKDAPQPQPNPDVTHSVLLLQAAQARQEAVKAADKGDYNRASTVLRSMAGKIDESGVMSHELKEEKDALLEQAQKMEKGTETYNEYSRKTMSTQAFYTMTNRHDDTVMLRFREQQRKVKDGGEKRDTVAHEVPAVDIEDSKIPKKPGTPPTYFTWNGQRFDLKSELIRLGRSSHNEIVINQQGVSRFHAQIRQADNKLIFEDLNSTNGSIFEGQLLSEPHELSVGDIVYIGDEKLIFRDDKE
jgi:Ca-activated chloride channel family protein